MTGVESPSFLVPVFLPVVLPLNWIVSRREVCRLGPSMRNPNLSLLIAAFQGAAICLFPFLAKAQFLPTEVGTTVNGFQDDFDAATLDANWAVRGSAAYSVSGGMLRATTVGGDPNHLLYELAGYDSSVQEVLARVRVNSFGTGDPSRAGIATAVTAASSQGINLMFRDEPNPGQRHFEFLDDTRAWGPEMVSAWWLRRR